MTRSARLAGLAAIALLGLAGCGSAPGAGSGPATGAPAPRAAAPGAGLQVGATDGRIGDATTDGSTTPERPLSRGGRLLPEAAAPNAHEGIGAAAGCPNGDLLPDATNLTTVAEATLCLVNAERTDRGLGVLRVHTELQRAAIGYAGDMVARSFFSHTGRDGSQLADRIRAAGYLDGGGQWTVGENLAWGTGELGTPNAIVHAWMASAGHRANILRADYREVGLGVVAGNPSSGASGATFATEFGVVTHPGAAARHRRSVARRASSRRARIALSPHGRRASVRGRVAAQARTAGLGTS